MNTTNSRHKDSNKELADHARETAASTVDTVTEEGADIASKAVDLGKEEARSTLALGKDAAASQLDSMSTALDSAAESLDKQDHTLASYANDLSSQISRLSEKLSTSSVDDLAKDACRVARDNPALFMVGTVAAGLVASRFFKADNSEDGSTTNSQAKPMSQQSTAAHSNRTAASYSTGEQPTINPPVEDRTAQSSRIVEKEV